MKEARKVACFRMPKVASLSLAFALGERCEMIHHADEAMPGDIVRSFREKNPGTFIFAFVRNPFDRLVSAYRWISQRDPVNNRASVEWQKHTKGYGSFGEFVREEVGTGKCLGILHLRTQSSWIVGGDGKLMVDWLGRYENLDADVQKLCGMMGWQGIRLEKCNSSDRAGYREYYTPKTAAIVAKAYEKDFEIGHYDKKLG